MHFHGVVLSHLVAPARCSREKDSHYADLWNDLEGVTGAREGYFEGGTISLIVRELHTLNAKYCVFLGVIPQHLVAWPPWLYMRCHMVRFDGNTSVTQCEMAENAAASPSQLLEIAPERKKAIWADRFCLTGLAPRSYFAGPPPSGCGGNEATSAICCGTIVDSGCSTWGWMVDLPGW